MKLLFTLTGSQLEALALSTGEKLQYCVPADLAYEPVKRGTQAAGSQSGNAANGGAVERYETDVFLAATNKRLVVLAGDQVTYQTNLKDCEKVRCEHQVGCGIITVTDLEGKDTCVARVSMKQIVRASYAIRGAQAIVRSIKEAGDAEGAEKITSVEYETYCEKCGRALPGTSHCPYCEGKLDIVKKFMNLCGGFVGKLFGCV